MRYSICFLPAVGIFSGGALLLWSYICARIGVGSILFAAVATILPLLITGGIHMDGFMDTVDALASHKSKELKLQILKDPHAGAFAVIYCGAYLLICFGLYTQLYRSAALPVVCIGFVLSRALSSFCACALVGARTSGMLNAFTQHINKCAALSAMGIVIALCIASMIWLHPLAGVLCALLCMLCCIIYRAVALNQFGGVTGDTAGFFLQLAELLILIGTCAAGFAA